jgi:hypothetical protein
MSKMLKQRSEVVPPIHGGLVLEKNRRRVREAFLKAACAETSCWPEQYIREEKASPLYLHCAAAATVIRVLFGGDIVTGKVCGERHYWNRLPDGQEVDFTSCQYGGDGFTPLAKGRKVKRKGKDELTNLRYLLFAKKVMERL